MKTTLVAGVSSTREIVVDRERTIDFMGESARVYATPMLVRDIEMTCRELLLAHLDGRGFGRHAGRARSYCADLLGMKVRIEANVGAERPRGHL